MYLYYKLYKAYLKSSLSDTAEFSAAVLTGTLIGLNLMTVYFLLAKIEMCPSIATNRYEGAAMVLTCSLISALYFLTGKRSQFIINRYTNEIDSVRIRGNIIIGLYVFLTFLSVVVVANYRAGHI
jgi:hypothetical protein